MSTPFYTSKGFITSEQYDENKLDEFIKEFNNCFHINHNHNVLHKINHLKTKYEKCFSLNKKGMEIVKKYFGWNCDSIDIFVHEMYKNYREFCIEKMNGRVMSYEKIVLEYVNPKMLCDSKQFTHDCFEYIVDYYYFISYCYMKIRDGFVCDYYVIQIYGDKSLKSEIIELQNQVKLLSNNTTICATAPPPESIISNIRIKKCSVCFSEIDEKYVIVPCGHTDLCKYCFEKIKETTDEPKCPNCRKSILLHIKYYD